MRKFGLIGRPLGHSASALYFTDKFSRLAIDARYDLYPLECIEQVESLRGELVGFNVTIPYKKEILPYLATVSEEAAKVGAVNCVKIDAERKMHGYNTDVVGIRASLSGLDLAGKKALVLGTGGASAAVVYVLKELGMEVVMVSRKSVDGVVTYGEVTDEIIAYTTLIVNATPVGMYPNVDNAPDINYTLLSSSHILFDLVYNPVQTRFLQLGAAQGATTISGDEMFRRQAEASWDIWNG